MPTFRVITRGALAIMGISACFVTTLTLRVVIMCGQTTIRCLLLLRSNSTYLSKLLAQMSERSYGWTVFWVHFYSKIFCRILAIKPRFFEFIDTKSSTLASGNGTNENTRLRPCTPHELKHRVMKLKQDQPNAKILLQANHISIIDIFLIGSVLKTSFVAKHDVKTWPVVGWMTSMVGVMFVHRNSMIDRYQAIFRLKKNLTSTATCVFPEATTTDHDTPRLDLWQSGNLYAIRPSPNDKKKSAIGWSHDTPGYVVALSVCYQDRKHNSWTGDLSFLALIIRILRRKQTSVSLIWSLMSYNELAGSTLRARSLSVFLRVWKQCQIGSELPPP